VSSEGASARSTPSGPVATYRLLARCRSTTVSRCRTGSKVSRTTHSPGSGRSLIRTPWSSARTYRWLAADRRVIVPPPQSTRSKPAAGPASPIRSGAPSGPSPPSTVPSGVRSRTRSTPSAVRTARSPRRAARPARTVTAYGRVPLYQSASTVSASGPTTATVRPGVSGSTASLFFSRTTLPRAASRASRWCSAQLTTSAVVPAYGLGPAGSNSPSRNRIARMCRTAASTSDSVSKPRASASCSAVPVVSASSVKQSTPARSAAANPAAWSLRYLCSPARLVQAPASPTTSTSSPVQVRSWSASSGLRWVGRPLTKLYDAITATAAPAAIGSRKAGSSYSCSTRGGRSLEVRCRPVSLL
jgi:hypothetical protein